MTEPGSIEESVLPISVLKRIDELSDRFESAWRNGQTPQIEDYLPLLDQPDRAKLLYELIAMEVEYRHAKHEQPTFEEYNKRFPQYEKYIRAAFESHIAELPSQQDDPGRQGPLIVETKHGRWAKEPPTLELFVQRLIGCGLMSSNEYQSFLDKLPESARPQTAEQLAKHMYSQGMLTKFQANALYQGKIRGLVLGNYIVLDRLGQGGMGYVYKAKHVRMDRLVAIKVLPANATKSPEAVKRFHREARAVAKLSHPNIVMAYDADEAEGVHFLVMEYIEGQDLAAAVLENGPMTVPEALNFLVQVARGLEYAHSRGIIHRDIKPSNLLLDKQRNIKILDMGLAHIKEAVGASNSGTNESPTNSGQVFGTLDYMSPEQALDAKLANARSDIYSLGCTLYYLLVGQPPYGGDSMAKKILAHREKPIPSLKVIRGDVPESLDLIFHRMMAKNPQDRPQSMAMLVTELHEINVPQSNTPVHLPVPPTRATETIGLHSGEIDTSSESVERSDPLPAGQTGPLSQPTQVEENFDPYFKWLGIPHEEQPPHHYRLLSIDLFESDPMVIEAATNRQMAYVQQCATSRQFALSQKLINELTEARLCLLDPKKKSLYDLQLRVNLRQQARLTGKKQPLAPKPAPLQSFEAKEPMTDGEPTTSTEEDESITQLEKLAKKSLFSSRRWWTNPVIMTIIGCLILTLILTLFFISRPQGPAIYYVQIDPPSAKLTVEFNLGIVTGTGRQRQIQFNKINKIPNQAEVHITASCKNYEDGVITLHPALAEDKNLSITLIKNSSKFDLLSSPIDVPGTQVSLCIPQKNDSNKKAFENLLSGGFENRPLQENVPADGKPYDPRRLKPNVVEVSDLKLTFEGFVTDMSQGKLPFYLYIAVTTLPSGVNIPKLMQADLASKINNTTQLTELTAKTPKGRIVKWLTCQATGKQLFYYILPPGEEGRVFQLKGTIQLLFIEENESLVTLIGAGPKGWKSLWISNPGWKW